MQQKHSVDIQYTHTSSSSSRMQPAYMQHRLCAPGVSMRDFTGKWCIHVIQWNLEEAQHLLLLSLFLNEVTVLVNMTGAATCSHGTPLISKNYSPVFFGIFCQQMMQFTSCSFVVDDEFQITPTAASRVVGGERLNSNKGKNDKEWKITHCPFRC